MQKASFYIRKVKKVFSRVPLDFRDFISVKPSKMYLIAILSFLANFSFQHMKGTVSRGLEFLKKVLNVLISTSVYVLMIFKIFKSFSLPYTIITFMVAS